MKRRKFLLNSSIGLTSLLFSKAAYPIFNNTQSSNFKDIANGLLKTWVDGMLAHQIKQENQSELHGALMCPACGTIHGRCMDAVLPFMYMADKTGEQKYLDAGIAVFEWSKNVSQPDGSWTVMPDPKTWKGISVFGAIALAETLHHYGHLLHQNTKENWQVRLSQVAEYLYKTFNLTFTNINYGFTSIYAFHILGEVLQKPKYTLRSHEMAAEIKNWLTVPNYLLFGEGKPSKKLSDKGLKAVDLGYNVEESLVAVVMYAYAAKDVSLKNILQKSLEGHLEFMFPDGSWDNSWGTRQYKWSYWGSRTTDGSLPAYALMAERNPSFARAVYQNTQLLSECTANGLLHGGPHFISHGVPPCIHHTFSHAKGLTVLLQTYKNFSLINNKTILPIEKEYGVKHFPEIDVHLVSFKSWRASISAYDFEYTQNAQQATGGAIGFLYHQSLGPIFTASMAKYKAVETFNQQGLKDEKEFTLTPRIEIQKDDLWYTNLYDRKAQISHSKKGQRIELNAKVRLFDENGNEASNDNPFFVLKYVFEKEKFTIEVHKEFKDCLASLVLPIVSKSGEKIEFPDKYSIKIIKEKGILLVKSNVPIEILDFKKSRVFNQVPGIEALPLVLSFKEGIKHVLCTLEVV